MTVDIDASLADDVGAITAIYAEVVRTSTASFELEPPTEADMAARRLAVLEAGLPFLVARRGASLVGYAYAGRFRPRPAYEHTVEDSVYVAAEARGSGVGRALLEALIDHARRLGKHQMIGIVGDPGTNRTSVRLHMAAGFCEVGRLDAVGRKCDRWLDLVILQRTLSAP